MSTENASTYVVREGTNTVGLHFVGSRAVYNARGWVRELKMLRDGPKQFALYFNNTKVAETTTGSITKESFTADALEYMKMKTLPDDKAAFLATENHINMTGIGSVVILADTPPDRQNYYVEQTWSQVFRAKLNAPAKTDADLEEVPCLLAYNLRSEDSTAQIQRTYVYPSTITSAISASS